MNRIILQILLPAMLVFGTISPASLARANPAAIPEQAEFKPLDAGFSEVVITTSSPEKWKLFLTKMAGWELRGSAPVGNEGGLWNLPAESKGTSYLFANKGAETGFIRLVHLTNVDQQHIRIDDRPWDTGGIFDFNVRVKNLELLREKMLANGWVGDSEPIQYVFGPFEVIEWIARGPDGVRIAFIERLKPELKGWPDLKVMSRVFNSTSIVKDMKSIRAFYEDVLGMKPYLLSNKPSDEAGPNVLGLPHNIATMVSRDVAILHPEGKNTGSVEFVKFVGATGSDFAALAKPSNYGISTLRFPVADLNKSIAALEARGVSGIAAPVEAKLAPYGNLRISGFYTPDGTWLEIFEAKLDSLQ